MTWRGSGESPCPEDPDVRLSITFAEDMRLEFVARSTAALVFVQAWAERNRDSATLTVHHGGTAGLPRLPTERLYIEP